MTGKRKKTHGEGGKIIGNVKDKKVLILDDVLTAGTALNQSIDLVRQTGGEVVSAVVALDREEYVEGELARDLIEDKTSSKLLSIARISQILDFLKQIEKELGRKAIRNYMPLQKGDVKQTLSDTNLLRKITGYNPKTEYKSGIKKFVNWYKDYYKIY